MKYKMFRILKKTDHDRISKEWKKIKHKDPDIIIPRLNKFVKYDREVLDNDVVHERLVDLHKCLYMYFPSHVIYVNDKKSVEVYGKNIDNKYRVKVNVKEGMFSVNMPSRSPVIGPSLIIFYPNGNQCIKQYVNNDVVSFCVQYYKTGEIFSLFSIGSGYREFNIDGTEKNREDRTYLLDGYFVYYERGNTIIKSPETKISKLRRYASR